MSMVFFRHRITSIWLLLVGATVLSWEIGHDFGISHPRYVAIAVIAVAFIKVRYVILDFMDIRNAPHPMRVAGEAWTLLVCVALIALYLRAG